MNCDNKNKIDISIDNNIDTNLNISKVNNIETSPSPKPLTPKTYKYCIKYLCYAPRIKKKELILDKNDKYKEFILCSEK
jgi:hypothetical protein